MISNTSFGRNVLTNNFDAEILSGWDVPSVGLGSQPFDSKADRRSRLRRGGLRRRWYHGFFVADNILLGLADLTPFELTTPKDRSATARRWRVTISDLFDVVPEKAGQVGTLVADSGRYGKWFHYFNGLDLTFDLRSIAGFTFMGGTSTGQTVADNCAVRERLPELSTTTTGTSAFGAGLNGSVVSPVARPATSRSAFSRSSVA